MHASSYAAWIDLHRFDRSITKPERDSNQCLVVVAFSPSPWRAMPAEGDRGHRAHSRASVSARPARVATAATSSAGSIGLVANC